MTRVALCRRIRLHRVPDLLYSEKASSKRVKVEGESARLKDRVETVPCPDRGAPPGSA
jgi:hypothetical protein